MRTTVCWVACESGRLGILPRPRGGDWLDDEVRGLRDQAVAVLASLLTPDEVRELDLLGEADACRAAGISIVSHPVPDRGVPASPEAFGDLMMSLAAAAGGGSSVAVHCRQGVGRAALLAAAILAARGLTMTAAFDRGRRRPGLPGPGHAGAACLGGRVCRLHLPDPGDTPGGPRMTSPGLYRLVWDALTARYMTGTGCFESNWACGQLAEIGVSALPAIEAVIETGVLPAYTQSPEALDRRFPGLLSLLVTYFAVGEDSGDGRVVSLFGRLCRSVPRTTSLCRVEKTGHTECDAVAGLHAAESETRAG
jgi:hypothetical protein